MVGCSCTCTPHPFIRRRLDLSGEHKPVQTVTCSIQRHAFASYTKRQKKHNSHSFVGGLNRCENLHSCTIYTFQFACKIQLYRQTYQVPYRLGLPLSNTSSLTKVGWIPYIEGTKGVGTLYGDNPERNIIEIIKYVKSQK